ncbi:MAG: NAD(P)-dependent oxidoreductase [Polyangiaceae bacterium]
MRVVVTGATGFLGHHLVRALLAEGHEVVAFARLESRTASLEALGITVARGSLFDAGDRQRILDGAEVVVHAAGGGMVGAREDILRANTETTRALVEAAPNTLQHFVLISSLAAHGPSEPDRPAIESDPDRPQSAYGESKCLAEGIALAARARFRVTALRAPALYGPGEHRLLPLFRLARRGVIPMVHPEGTLSLLHGADCARAVTRAIAATEADSGVYYLAEPRRYRRSEMARLIAAAVGREARILPIPTLGIRAAGRASEVWARLSGQPSPLSRDKVRDLVGRHQACDPTRAIHAFAWQPAMAFREGAVETYRDYLARGWLPPER